MKPLLSLFFLIVIGATYAETSYDSDGFEIISTAPSHEVLSIINSAYQQKVRPIFANKCLACHGVLKEMPWYYAIPGVKQLIDHDMHEAKQEMDMSQDFPFKGHGAALDDLQAVQRELQKESMPPLQYKIIHWNSSLTKAELKMVNQWIEDSINQIQSQ